MKFFRVQTNCNKRHHWRCFVQFQVAKHHRDVCRVSLQLCPASCGVPPDHTVQECAFRCNASIRVDLPCALSVVHGELHALEPYLFVSGHLHRDVVAVNEWSRVSDRGITESLSESGSCQDLRAMRLSTRARVHCAVQCTFFQQASVLGLATSSLSLSLSLSLASRFLSSSRISTNDLRNGTPWKCARLMSYIARVRLPFASSGLRETGREWCFHTFQRWHSAEEFSGGRDVGFLRGLLDFSHDQSRSVVRSIRIALVCVDPSATTSFRKTGSRTPMPRHQLTSSCRACLSGPDARTPHVVDKDVIYQAIIVR